MIEPLGVPAQPRAVYPSILEVLAPTITKFLSGARFPESVRVEWVLGGANDAQRQDAVQHPAERRLVAGDRQVPRGVPAEARDADHRLAARGRGAGPLPPDLPGAGGEDPRLPGG